MSVLHRKRKCENEEGLEANKNARICRAQAERNVLTMLSSPPGDTYNGFKASDSPSRCYLSNLFGGAEFVYMAQRFACRPRVGSQRLAALLHRLAAVDFDADYERFQTYRFRLTGKRTDAYLKEGRVAAGVLATLINGCFRKSMKKRLAVVNAIADELGVPGTTMSREDFFIDDDADLAEKKKEWMRQAHKVKFSKPFYHILLKHTHPGWLFERKNGRRDANNNWAGREGWMAQVLRETKSWLEQSDGAGDAKSLPDARHNKLFLRF